MPLAFLRSALPAAIVALALIAPAAALADTSIEVVNGYQIAIDGDDGSSTIGISPSGADYAITSATGDLEPPAPHEALPGLERTLRDRAAERPEGSYTVALLDDPPLIGEKVMEEAEEVSRAVREESDDRVAEEAADVLFHLAALIRSRGITISDVEEVLNGRRA